MRNAPAVILLTLLLAVACRGDRDQDDATSSSPSAEPTIATSRRPLATTPATHPLAGALIEPEELGRDWQEARVADPTVATNYFCGASDDLLDVKPDTPWRALERTGNPAILLQYVVRLPDGDAATERLRAFRELTTDCAEWVSTDGVRRTEWQTEPIALSERFADETHAVRVTEVGGAGLHGYLVVVRIDDTLSAVVLLQATNESPEPLIAQVAQKLQRVVASRG